MDQSNMKRRIKLPSYQTKFNVEENPLIHDPLVEVWMKQLAEYSLIPEEKWAKIEISKFYCAYSFHDLADIKRWEILVKFFVLYFILDDHTECDYGHVARDTEEADKVWGQVVMVLDKLSGDDKVSTREWKPYISLLYNVMEDMFRDVETVTKDRTIRFYRDYAMASMVETKKINIDGGFQSLDEIVKIKRDSMALYSVIQTIEYGLGITISEQEWNDRDFKEILAMATDALLYANDFGSFEKEFNDNNRCLEKTPNSIAQVVLRDKCSIEEAVIKVKDYNEEYEKKIIEAINRFTKTGNKTEAQKKFLKQLNYLCGANYYCSVFLHRYYQDFKINSPLIKS